MRIDRITFQMRNDFKAIMKCEFCGHEQLNNSGYHDTYYHQQVIPAMKCEECGKSTSEENKNWNLMDVDDNA